MKRTISILLAVILICSIVAFPISASTVTDDDILYFKSNIQRIKDYISKNGKEYQILMGQKYLYIRDSKTENNQTENADILYYPDSDKIELEFTSSSDIPGIIDITSVTFCDISFEKQSFFKYFELLGNYGTSAYSSSFDMINYNPDDIITIHFTTVDNQPGKNASQEYIQVKADYFFDLQYKAYSRWNSMLKELFGFYLQGIGISASRDEHSLNKSGYCELCGRRFVDTSNCSCTCHKNDFFSNFLTGFKMIFWKLFKIKQTCDCGLKHY